MRALILAIVVSGCTGIETYPNADFGEMRSEMPCIESIYWYPDEEALNLAVIRSGYKAYSGYEVGVYNKKTECWTMFFVTPREGNQVEDLYTIGHGFAHLLSETPHWHNPPEGVK